MPILIDTANEAWTWLHQFASCEYRYYNWKAVNTTRCEVTIWVEEVDVPLTYITGSGATFLEAVRDVQKSYIIRDTEQGYE